MRGGSKPEDEKLMVSRIALMTGHSDGYRVADFVTGGFAWGAGKGAVRRAVLENAAARIRRRA